MRKYFIVLIIYAIPLLSFGQTNLLIDHLRDSIRFTAQQMVSAPTDSQRIIYSQRISKYITTVIKQKHSIEADMDSLRLVKVLTSPNKFVRIYTWAIPLANGTYKYNGIAQVYVKRKKEYRTIIMHDKGANIGRAFNKSLNANKWYGAYYYKLIQTKRGSKYFYTLLGWRGINKTIQSKVIEVLTLRYNGDMVFGYNLFKIKGYNYFHKTPSVKRLIYVYSSLATMYLNYDMQTIVLQSHKKKRSHKRKKSTNVGFIAQEYGSQYKNKVKRIKDKLIVMDRLVPSSPEVVDFHSFYFPESNIIDALRFEKNMWKYYPDIDARNKANPNNGKKRKIEYDLTPSK